MSIYSGSQRIELLFGDIMHLVSVGYKESFDEVVKQLSQGTLLKYLHNKYKNELFILHFDTESPYDFAEWESVLDEYAYLTFYHDVQKQMGIMNKDDGLLVLLNIIIELALKQKRTVNTDT